MFVVQRNGHTFTFSRVLFHQTLNCQNMAVANNCDSCFHFIQRILNGADVIGQFGHMTGLFLTQSEQSTETGPRGNFQVPVTPLWKLLACNQNSILYVHYFVCPPFCDLTVHRKNEATHDERIGSFRCHDPSVKFLLHSSVCSNASVYSH